jgi:hypothetical protein
VNSKPGKSHRITHLNAQIKVQELENVIVEENSEGVYNTMWCRELKRTCKAKYSTRIFIRLCGKEAHVSRAPLLSPPVEAYVDDQEHNLHYIPSFLLPPPLLTFN